ncbi:MAG: acyl carrier protein [Parahaliea sp.]
MKSEQEIRTVLTEVLINMFEVDPAAIQAQARLYEDLDIDSIDAVDLVVELRNITGKKIDPDEFKSVRTVDDVVAAISRIVAQ